jgi:acyl-CoA thioesterase I
MQIFVKNRKIKKRISSYLVLLALCLSPTWVFAKTVMVLGDSISAGYGIEPQQAWVNLLQKRLTTQSIIPAKLNHHHIWLMRLQQFG